MDGLLSKRTEDDINSPVEMRTSSLRISHVEIIEVPHLSKSQVSFEPLSKTITYEESVEPKVYKPQADVQRKGKLVCMKYLLINICCLIFQRVIKK